MSSFVRAMSGVFDLKTETNKAGTSSPAMDRMSRSTVSPSPLKIFGLAKKRICDVFVEVNGYITDMKKFVQEINDDMIISATDRVKVGEYTQKVMGIRDVLSRDHMKVVFFGRTSNGKSTVINSMLRSKLLPSGIGHTTHCFVQVEGCDSDEGYLLLEGSAERKNVLSLKELANALSAVKLQANSLIRICWPKNKCTLLKDDVVLVDSPGIDVSPDLDSWIDKHCLDADVFVLVANAESTLMQTEKNFFLKVSDRLSKPMIFILNNRWDASANEPEMMEEVRNQHMERNVEFLCNELKVVNSKEAEDRIFFVSAKEALQQRLAEAGVSTTPSPVLEGFQARLFEFANFERRFEESISRSAVKTKFSQHAKKGKQIVSELRIILELLLERSLGLREEGMKSRHAADSKLSLMERQLGETISDIESNIRSITDEVEQKVSQTLCEEIKLLSHLVGEFDKPFHDNPYVLDVYKQQLHAHVEEGLGRKIQERCSRALNEAVYSAERRMTEKFIAMLPEERRATALCHLPEKDKFDVSYRLDAKNLCSDFKEDICFRFSWSITAIVERYLGKKIFTSTSWGFRAQLPVTVPPAVPKSSSLSYTSGDVVQLPARPALAADHEDLAVILLRAAPALASTSTLSVIVVAGAISKAVGWKLLAFVGGIYGMLYAYERLMWSNRAKERAFKRQYVDFASSKLRMIVDMTSTNASHQVQQELSTTFSRLKHEVNLTKTELKAQIVSMDLNISQLDSTASKARTLRNKAGWLDTELNDFISRFIEYA